MSSDEEVMFLDDFSSTDSLSESSESGEFEMVSIVRPYTHERTFGTLKRWKRRGWKRPRLTLSRYFTWSIPKWSFCEWLISNHYLWNAVFFVQALWLVILCLLRLIHVCMWRVRKESLVGSLEYRCCLEIAAACKNLTFDGSIEHIKHEGALYKGISSGVLADLAPPVHIR